MMKKTICLMLCMILFSFVFAAEKTDTLYSTYLGRDLNAKNNDLIYADNFRDSKEESIMQINSHKRNFVDINISDFIFGILNISYYHKYSESTLMRFGFKWSFINLVEIFDTDKYYRDLLDVKYYSVKYSFILRKHKEGLIISDFLDDKYWGLFVELGYIPSKAKKFSPMSPPSIKQKHTVIPQIGIFSGYNLIIYNNIFANFEVGGGLCLPPIRLKIGLGIKL